MSHHLQRPTQVGRLTTSHHLGTSASCLILSILAANQTAARPNASLPYLVQSTPMSLRVSLARLPNPPPPPLNLKPTSDKVGEPDYDPTHLSSEQLPLYNPTPAVLDPSDKKFNHIPTPDIPQGAPGSVPLIPDQYTRPTPVRVEDLLPFLLPAPRPVSRAVYELK